VRTIHNAGDVVRVTENDESRVVRSTVGAKSEGWAKRGRGRERRKGRRRSNLLCHVGIANRPFEEPHHKEERSTSSLVWGNTWYTAEPY